MGQGLFVQAGEVLAAAGKTPAQPGGVLGHGDGQGVQRRIGHPMRLQQGFSPLVGGGRGLALGQGVNLVVVHHQGEVGVLAQRRQEVVAPLTVAVAVPGRRHHFESMIGQADAGGHRQGAAMDAVNHVALEIVREFPRLADTRDDRDVLRANRQLRQGLLEGLEHGKIAAARTPGALDALI